MTVLARGATQVCGCLLTHKALSALGVASTLMVSDLKACLRGRRVRLLDMELLLLRSLLSRRRSLPL